VGGFYNNSSDLTHLNSGFLGRHRTTYHRQCNIRTHVVTVDTAKHFIIPTETLFI